MNKTSKTLLVVICLFFLTFMSLADASSYPKPPKPPKVLPFNMVSWTSLDSTLNNVPVSDGAYQLKLDGYPSTWYYLGVSGMIQSPPPADGYYFFRLNPVSDETFNDYWSIRNIILDGSGPFPNEGTWQYVMALILYGYAPMFILKIENGNYMLIDGLQFYWSIYQRTYNGIPADLPDGYQEPMRLNGDYPSGIYGFTCYQAYTLQWIDQAENQMLSYSPQIAIQTPTVQVKNYDIRMVYWTSPSPTPSEVPIVKNIYQLTLDKNPNTWYYLGLTDLSPVPYDGLYPFDWVPPPAKDTAFWNYWAAKGVTPGMSDDGSWQYFMSTILTGDNPMFFVIIIDGDYHLVDTLSFYLTVKQGGFNNFRDIPYDSLPLRLNGDYPAGTYSFIGDPGFNLYTNEPSPNYYANGFAGYKISMQIK